MAVDIEDLDSVDNLAELLDEDSLDTIGSSLKELIDDDDASRQEWLDNNAQWLRLAGQVREDKSFPWQDASNIKYPLLTMASVQFHARALPNLINSGQPVNAKIHGEDSDGSKTLRCNRIKKFMSYQVMEDMEEWMDDFDRLLICLPIIGLCYKKTYFSSLEGRPKSPLLLPQDVIVNYHATDYKRARITHRLLMDQNEFKEHVLAGLYLDVELSNPSKQGDGVRDESLGLSHIGGSDEDPYEIYESHCWLDLDEDGYKEPYIVTLHADSGKLLRIVPRWDENNVFYREGKVVKIVPDEYFTPFIFMPDPNSSVYGIGLGSLVGPTNEAVNTIVNQLVDAGTLSNLQSGFLARGIKLKGGATRFRPGEWKIVNTTGDDLRKGVFPMPVREPSGVLFNLLGLLIESGQQVAAVSDMMLGQNPGQNQPATTTMAVLEQGLKVFTSIYKRVHRSLGKEYQKLYKLNYNFFDANFYNNFFDEVDEQGNAVSYNKEEFDPLRIDITPASDPNIVSEAQQAVKAQSLLEKMSAGLPINVEVATRRMLEAERHEDIDDIMDVSPPGPDPKVVIEETRVRGDLEIRQAQLQLEAQRLEFETAKLAAQTAESLAKAQAAGDNVEIGRLKTIIDAIEKDYKMRQSPVNSTSTPEPEKPTQE